MKLLRKLFLQKSFICINGEYDNFVRGDLYDPTGDIHIYSSNPVVVPTSEIAIIHASNVIRKVMFYP